MFFQTKYTVRLFQSRILARSFVSSSYLPKKPIPEKTSPAESPIPQTYQTYINPGNLSNPPVDPSNKNLSIHSLLNTMPYPLDGVFAINKPSGPTSADAVASLKGALNNSALVLGSRAWAKANGMSTRKPKKENWKKRQQNKRKGVDNGPSNDIKVGHGGTLDPLASGVIVIGIGSGTQKLQGFLTDCTKVYETTVVFGAATTTYDVTGKVLEYAGDVEQKVTEDSIKDIISKHFSGEITQYPPVYSAIKMDGKRLYEYAREGVPLPRKIESRQVTVDFFEVVPGSVKVVTKDELTTDKAGIATEQASQEEKDFYLRESMPPVGAALRADQEPQSYVMARLRFAVSSGTYIRSLIHDLARALNVSAYMQTLERVRQGPFILDENVFDLDDIITFVRGNSRAQSYADPKPQSEPQETKPELQHEKNNTGDHTSKSGVKEEEWVAMIKKMITDGPNVKIEQLKTLVREEFEKKQLEAQSTQEPAKSEEEETQTASVSTEELNKDEEIKNDQETENTEPKDENGQNGQNDQINEDAPPAKKIKLDEN